MARLGYMLKKETTMRVAFVALCLARVGGTMSAPVWAVDKPADKSGYRPPADGRRVRSSRRLDRPLEAGPVAPAENPLVKPARHGLPQGWSKRLGRQE
jgi:hypothetical protein